ncbi:hypothetical protein VCHA34P129_280046 [Vibrio chagasii]|nr:hypothetical protein VCHA34P129_280046 [Vibrio chagasii]CAH7151499.1 hypothetical protein VCHA52P455_290003 [Vibrio chagasii]
MLVVIVNKIDSPGTSNANISASRVFWIINGSTENANIPQADIANVSQNASFMATF